MIFAAEPVIVRFPPTEATNERIAQAYLLCSSSREETFGLANWITGTFPRNWDKMRTNEQIPMTEDTVWNGDCPTILPQKYRGNPVDATFSRTMKSPG